MTKTPYFHVFTLILSLSIAAFAAGSKAPATEVRELVLELGAPFQDNAVLQREMNVPVWGWSKAGTKVTVTFAGQTKEKIPNNLESLHKLQYNIFYPWSSMLYFFILC